MRGDAYDVVVVGAGLVGSAIAYGLARAGQRVALQVPVYPEHGQILVTERTAPWLDYPTLNVRQTDEGSLLLGASQAERSFDTSVLARTSRDIAQRALRTFPCLGSLRIVRTWGALRVMTPDGFPIYDRSKTHPGVFVFTCHSGVTLAANHALEVSRWVIEDRIPDERACFSTERFNGSQAA